MSKFVLYIKSCHSGLYGISHRSGRFWMRPSDDGLTRMTFSRGFTLIELLVVIAIIGILTAFLVANFIGVKQRARDAQRKSDLRNIQAALEIYRSDNGSYPDPFPSSCGSAWQQGTTVYMQTVPCDPLNTGQFKYTYNFSSGAYSLIACLENVKDSQKDTSNSPPCDITNNTNWSYSLKNP